MKPHVAMKNGRWAVWRHRSSYPWQLPTVVRDGFKEAVEAHYRYVNIFEG